MMALQPMILLDELVRPGSTVDASTPKNPHASRLVDGRLVELLNEAVRVEVSDDIVSSVPLQNGATLDGRSAGPLRLPFPTMWLEWYDDAGVRGSLKSSDNDSERWPAAQRLGMLCQEIESQAKGECSYLIHSFFSWTHNGQITSRGFPERPIDGYTSMVRVDLDAESGDLKGFSAINPNDGSVATEEERDLSVSRLWVGLMAIGLMNCRNVSIERHDRAEKPSKKQRRVRKPKLDYHTISLPGSASSSSAGTGEGGKVAMHRVRGHFKTFTAAAPLMGQHVGTYWWGWQVRGSRYNGATVTDYKVGV